MMNIVSLTPRSRSRLSLFIGAAVLLSLLASFAQPIIAAAHPLGNFTTNRYSRLELAPERVRVNCDLRHVNVVLCCDPKAFLHTNPLEGLEPGGAFVWESDASPETAWERIPVRHRQWILDHKIRVFILPGNYRLLVGHDVEELEGLRRILRRALASSLGWLVLIGTIGGLFVARRVLMRVDAMSASAAAIMGGHLSGRLPIAGSGDELDRLASNLNAMLARIETLLKGMKEVSDNIAHDLRTPLTRLRNNADEALREKDPERKEGALEKIIGDADELIRIFDALLTIARAESGSGPKMEDFDVAQVARDVSELYEVVAEERDVAFSSDIDPALVVRGNRELIAQALSNLLDNGLKYGVPPAAGATASLRLVARRRGTRAYIAIEDRGPGVPVADRGRVLERFVRLEASRTMPGSGLGLSLVAAIVRLHNGSVLLEDNAPGLRVVIDLPLAAGLPQVAAPAKEPSRAAAK